MRGNTNVRKVFILVYFMSDIVWNRSKYIAL